MVFDLETACGILEEHGDGAKVSVLGDAGRRAVGELGGRNGWVVKETELVLSAVMEGLEVILRNTKGNGKSGEDLEFGLEGLFVKVLHELAETGEALLRNPDVVDEVISGGAHVESLLDIAGLERAKTLLVATDVGNVLLADVAVSSVGVRLGRVLGDHLCLVGKVEELLGLRDLGKAGKQALRSAVLPAQTAA